MDNNDKLLTTVNEIAKAAKENAEKGEASMKAFVEKSGEDLKAAMAPVETQLTSMNDRLEAIELRSDDNDEEGAFQKIINGGGDNSSVEKAAMAWGYGRFANEKGDPDIQRNFAPENFALQKALYKGHVTHHMEKGFINNGTDYELPDHVYQMNDMIFLLASQKVLKNQNTSHPMTYIDAVKSLDTYGLWKAELASDPRFAKALSTSVTAQGTELVPTGLSSQLTDYIRLELRVAAQFPNIVMPAGFGVWQIPAVTARMKAYLIGEATSDSATEVPKGTPTTGNITFTPKTHGVQTLYSYEINEDSAIALAPMVQRELARSLADALETSIINGDITDSTHFDSDVTSSNDVRKGWDGLRFFSGNSAGNAAVDISTLNLTNLRAIRKAMGRFGVRPNELAWITGISGFIQMLGLDEVKTLDKFGTNFTVKTGGLAMFDGAPVVVSEFIREDLNTSGVYDGLTTTDTEVLLANTAAHWIGEKPSGVLVETDKDIATRQFRTVTSRRAAFSRVHSPGDDEATVGIGYSLTS